MSTVRRVTKRIALLWALARAIPWRVVWKTHDRSADRVVWIHHRYPRSWLTWVLREDTIVKDAALVVALAEAGLRYRFVGGTGIEGLSGRHVFYSIHPYNPDRSLDYSASLMAALRRAEARGNVLFPSADAAEWWENKAFMHERFEVLGINCPRTIVLRSGDALPEDAPAFPLLLKDPHSSGSRGLWRCDDAEGLADFRRSFHGAGHDQLLVQELLDMRRDLRVTLVGDKIVHHYFRINEADTWRPTSTKHGSVVDFESFPDHWRQDIIEAFRKTDLPTGAFDICWRQDDLTTQPYFLEVSPAYTPNPCPPDSMRDRPYRDFKKKLFGPDSYPRASVDLVFDIHRMVVEQLERQSSDEGL